jgi:phosphoribosylglycinamide formyltransferase-1
VAALENAAIELVVMAGWMRIVTGRLIQAYQGRLINIHPSLLPNFRGTDAVGQALAAGAPESGCTVHEVVEAVDAGPILAQAAVPIFANDDHASLAARIQQEEHRILPQVVLARAQQLRPRAQG